MNISTIFRLSVLVPATAVVLAACATTIRTELVEYHQSTDCVVLLHGLNRSWRTMGKMAERLQQDGFSTANVDYPSSTATIEELAPRVINEGLGKCRQTGAAKIHFVTHSLGGILVRYYQGQEPIPDLGRVVMLGPPNQGSEVIDMTKDWPGIEILSGEAGLQLGTDEDSIPSQLGPVDFELGVIAGTGTTNPFMSSLMLPEEDDGKVTVERTQVEGMDDFIVVSNSHFAMMRSDPIIEATIRFLRNGSFEEQEPAD